MVVLLAAACVALAGALGVVYRRWRRELREHRWCAQLLQASGQALLVVDEGCVAYCNQVAERLFNRRPGSLRGQPACKLFACSAGAGVEALCETGDDAKRTVLCRRADGSVFWARLQAVPLPPIRPRQPPRYGIAITDATAERAEHSRLAAAAHSDALTGLHNRGSFQQVLDMEAQRAARYGRVFSLAMLDVDHFKRVNDRFGHLVGDEVLKKLAGLLRSAVRGSDVLCRYGGEEFALLLPETAGPLAYRLCERLRRMVESARWWDGVSGPARVTVTVGIAEFPHDGRLPRELIERADARLYAGKQAGRNRVVFGHEAATTSETTALSPEKEQLSGP